MVDDGSSDGTTEIIRAFNPDTDCEKIFLPKRQGKGAAIIQALGQVHGDYVIFQDADFEYDPLDFVKLLEYANRHRVPVVYGSRFMHQRKYPNILFRIFHSLINWGVNLLYRVKLTDVETCYKLIRSDLLKSLRLTESGFNIDPQITAQLLRRGYSVTELPVSYFPRNYSQGKKIGWWDGVTAFWIFLKYRFLPAGEVGQAFSSSRRGAKVAS